MGEGILIPLEGWVGEGVGELTGGFQPITETQT
jgi:hypothetical protein